jgi:hypothetical protein
MGLLLVISITGAMKILFDHLWFALSIRCVDGGVEIRLYQSVCRVAVHFEITIGVDTCDVGQGMCAGR